MSRLIAIVREPGASFVHAISTHPEKSRIDIGKAREQHRRYARALEKAGARLEKLETLESYPDGPFVEDTAIIFPHCAVRCPMKETRRLGETESSARAVARYRTLRTLPPPATLDGGDALDTPRALYVGLSSRTNASAIESLAEHARKPVIPVPVLAGLHLKTSASYLGQDVIVLAPARVDTRPLRDFRLIELEESESYGANFLVLDGKVIMPAGFPRLAELIGREAFIEEVIEVEMSEFEKADGGPTCLSLIIRSD